MAFSTYMLRCADNSYYTGHSDDLERRFAQHQSGEFRGYTFERRPVELVWAEHFASREEALAAELRIKNWSRAKKEALIARNRDRHSRLAVPPTERAERTTSASLGLVPRLRSGGTERVCLADTEPTTVRSALAPPAIVLVRPQLGENIGKAARAMLNFGLTDLRLVAPRDGWPNPAAGPAAAGADAVLEGARVFATLAEAVADCGQVYATTVRKRGVTKPVVTPEQAAAEMRGLPVRSAIVFGPERSGLETDEVALARTILTVPINPGFASLNLAQAVILCAYEWSKHDPGDEAHVATVQPTAEEILPPAPQAELDGFIEQLEAMLRPRGYFHPHSRAAATRRTLRTVLTKPGWNHLEVRTLRGVLSTLAREPD